MLKDIFLAATLIFGASQDNLDLFTIQTNDADVCQSKNLNLQFRSIDLHNLEQRDQQSFVNVLCDFDANAYAYGPEVAEYLATIPSAKVLANWIQGQDSKLTKMPDHQKIMHHWIIEDIDNEYAFVGRICLHTYISERPDDYTDTYLLAFGLTIASTHRNQKIFSRIAAQTLHTIASCKRFQDATFCFDTDTNNLPMHLAAQKLGAQKIHSWAKEFNVDNQKMIQNFDLFIIPKENK